MNKDTPEIKINQKMRETVEVIMTDGTVMSGPRNTPVEAFIKAYRGLATFRGESAFYTWLYRIAINTAKNHLVSAGRRVPDQGVDATDAEQYDDGALLRDADTPERNLMTGEVERTVYRTIESLPAELREAVTLREMEGLSYEEIAAVMDCPIGTVRSRIFRAREAIDAAIRPLLDNDGKKR